MEARTKAEQKAARKAELEAAKAAKATALQAALDSANAALKPPAALSEWGVMKTRCWEVLHDKLRRLARLKRKNRVRLNELTGYIKSIDD